MLFRLESNKTTHFSYYLFQDDWGIGLAYNIICFLILRLPDLPKNILVFWKLFFHRSTNQDKPARTVALKNNFFMGWNTIYCGVHLYYHNMLWWCQQNYPFFSDTRTAGSKQGGQAVWDSVFYVIGGHIIKPLTFLELVRILNLSVPCRGLLFLSLPPLFHRSTAFLSGCRLVFRIN